MGESLTTEHVYLSVSSFPVVVLTECGLLSDLERTTVMEFLEDLIDQSERHALIIDLTEAMPLPEKQRIYLAEAMQMRAKTIKEKWAALAVVVGGPEHLRLTKAEFWIGICPVPGRVFPSLEAATAWAEECLGLGPVDDAAAQVSAEDVPEERVSKTTRLPAGLRPIERGARSNKAPSVSHPAPARGPTPTPKAGKQGKTEDASNGQPKTGFAKLGRRGLAALSVVAITALLLVLGPQGDGGLSSAEAAAFEKLKSGVGLRVYRTGGNGEQLLTSGDKSAPGDKLGFEVDIPAKGYMMILGVKSDASVYSVFPRPGASRASSVTFAKNQRLPISYQLDKSTGKQSFYVVYCPTRFEVNECDAAGGAKLKCPPDCASAGFAVDKS